MPGYQPPRPFLHLGLLAEHFHQPDVDALYKQKIVKPYTFKKFMYRSQASILPGLSLVTAQENTVNLGWD